MRGGSRVARSILVALGAMDPSSNLGCPIKLSFERKFEQRNFINGIKIRRKRMLFRKRFFCEGHNEKNGLLKKTTSEGFLSHDLYAHDRRAEFIQLFRWYVLLGDQRLCRLIVCHTFKREIGLVEYCDVLKTRLTYRV